MSSKLFIEKLPVDWCGFGSLTARAGNISKGSEVPQLLNTIQNIVRVRDESVLYYRLIKELVACSYKLIMTYYGGGINIKVGSFKLTIQEARDTEVWTTEGGGKMRNSSITNKKN